MLKKILAILAMLYAVASFAAVDVNKATAAELDGLKGIGPGISSRIVDERKKGDFKNWNDFIERVKGVGEKTAAKFSSEGMTVNGASYSGVPATKAEGKTTTSKKTEEKAAAAPAATTEKAADAKHEKEPKAAKGSKKAKADSAAAAAPAASASATKK